MTTATLGELVDRHGVDVFAQLDRTVDIPVLDGMQAQGDLLVIPAAVVGGDLPAATQPVPTGGVEPLRGQHPHTLLGDCRYRRRTGQDLAVVDVGSEAFLAHPEHGYLGIASGRYVIRRQREQAAERAAEERLVID